MSRESSYHTKGKTPYRYSDAYHRWRSNPTEGNSLAHHRHLVQAFGRGYWRYPKEAGKKLRGRRIFNEAAYN